jgi:hypothetical protein
MVPIVVLMFWIGIYPSTFLRKMDASSAHLLEQMRVKQVLAACEMPHVECGRRQAEITTLRTSYPAFGEQTR